jgi:hypothetical protein
MVTESASSSRVMDGPCTASPLCLAFSPPYPLSKSAIVVRSASVEGRHTSRSVSDSPFRARASAAGRVEAVSYFVIP